MNAVVHPDRHLDRSRFYRHHATSTSLDSSEGLRDGRDVVDGVGVYEGSK